MTTFADRAWEIHERRLDANQALVAHIALSLDEHIADAAGGDPAKVVAVLRGLGMNRTADLLADRREVAGRCGQTPPTIINHAPRPVCALPAGHIGWHCADDGCEWGIAEANQQ